MSKYQKSWSRVYRKVLQILRTQHRLMNTCLRQPSSAPVNWPLSKKKFYVNSFKSWGGLCWNRTWPFHHYDCWRKDEESYRGNWHCNTSLPSETRLTSRWCPKVQVKLPSCLLSQRAREGCYQGFLSWLLVKVSGRLIMAHHSIKSLTSKPLNILLYLWKENLVGIKPRVFYPDVMSNNTSRSWSSIHTGANVVAAKSAATWSLQWSRKIPLLSKTLSYPQIAREKLAMTRLWNFRLYSRPLDKNLKIYLVKSRNFSIIIVTDK